MTSPGKLNILYVGTLPPHPGGSAISGSQLIVEFARLGHAVHGLAPITPEAFRSGDTFARCHAEICVRRFPVPHFETSVHLPVPDDYRALERDHISKMLPALIREKQPDIIMIGRETFARYIPDLARAHSVPCILRVAGATTTGLVNGNYPEAMVEEFCEQFRKINLLVAPAEHLARSLRQYEVDNIKVIHNAVDLQQFSPRPKDSALLEKLAVRQDYTTVLYVANLNQRKRPLDLVESAAEALRCNSKLVYVIVGDGLLRSAMETACKKRRVYENFRFVGWIDYEHVPNYINLADVVVLPSEGEGLARVYLETQACARLLIASDIPPAREVIDDGETGLLFRKGDIGDLTAKTLLAAGDPKLRADIGRKGWERVQAHSLDDAVAAYVSTLKEVIRQHQG